MVAGVFGKLGHRYFGWTAHSHACSLTLYLHTSSPSVSASFYFFLQQQKLPFNPCYGHSWLSKCDFIPASWKKKDAEESGSTTRPSKHSENSRPTARAAGPQVEPIHSFWSRQFREKEENTAPDASQKRREECRGWGEGTRRVDQNGSGLSVTHAGQFTSARVCVGYSEIPSGLRQRAARRVSPAPTRNHVKLQNAFPVVASVAAVPTRLISELRAWAVWTGGGS